MTLPTTNIELLTHRWNPITGCSGEDCSCRDTCWAARPFRGHKPDMSVAFHPEVLGDVVKRKEPAAIGGCWGGDMWDQSVKPEWRREVWNAVDHIGSDLHTFLFLTKHPERIQHNEIPDFPNIWLGVSVTNWRDWWRVARINKRQIGCEHVHRYVMIEPVIDTLFSHTCNEEDVLFILKHSGIEFAAIGAETPLKGSRTKVEWLLQATQICHNAGIQMMLKNNVEPYYDHMYQGGGADRWLGKWFYSTRPIPWQLPERSEG